jgi:hypothetical protein
VDTCRDCGHSKVTHSVYRGCYAYRCDCQHGQRNMPVGPAVTFSPFVRRALAAELPAKVVR